MLKVGKAAARGVSLVELLIALAALSILLMLAVPNMATWIQNTQIRTAAEGMQAGLNLARAEALRRNTTVRFQLVDGLDAGCVLSQTGKNWVVSLGAAEGACDQAPSDAGVQIIQKRSGEEGSANAVVTASGGSEVWFNGLGRLITPPTAPAVITQINVTNPAGGACKTAASNDPMRCLRITITTGGQVRTCDPAVDDNTDPRYC